MTDLLSFEPGSFGRGFGNAPVPVRHTLTDHPLLTLDSIASLADGLPTDRAEHNFGDVPEVLPGGEAPRADLTPGEIVRGIDTNGCWMVLKNIELDPRYRGLLDESLDEVAANADGVVMSRRQGYIFLSAPGSVTPVHFDPEHNLLLQIRGTKEMHVGRWDDPRAEEHELERYYGGGHRNLAEKPSLLRTFALQPGDGVYVPVHAPHWVVSGDVVSVSLSITFYTPEVEQDATLYAVNGRLRNLGRSPSPAGAHPVRDRAKVACYRAARRVARARNVLRRAA